MTAEPSQPGRPRRRIGPAPLAPIAIAVVAGVVGDRYAGPFGTSAWTGLALVAALVALVALVAGRSERVSRWGIVVLYAAIGGAHHHHRWSDLAPDHLARSIPDEAAPRPAWLRGVLVQVPEFRPPEFPDDEGHTRTVLDVEGVCDGLDWHPASGRVRLILGGDRTDLAMGEPVQAAGTLGPIEGPRNPGESDFRAALRGEGTRLRLSADGISAWPDPEGRSRPLLRALGLAREWSRRTLTNAIGPDSGPLAAALVLGRREAVDPDVNDAFARTGTTHLLAISGLHLQVLALAILLACRLVGFGPSWSAGLAALAAIGYAILVGPMPSVVRSTAMTVVACIAVLRSRTTCSANVLAAAALATIAGNPADVFDVGCQLSFLAVAAILWLVPWVVGVWRHDLPRVSIDPQAFVIELRRPDDPLDALERRLAPRWKKVLWWVRDWVALMLIVSAVVWLATAPLVALRFHLVSPIGIPLNVPLIPLTSLALVLAAATLGLSALWPPLGMPTAWAAATLLGCSEAIVRWGAGLSWGHAFTPGPSAWWVAGSTGLLAWLAYGAATGRARSIRGAIVALGVWGLGGLSLALAAPRSVGPEVEVLAVDHGLAVLVLDGDGGTMLYDCGRMRDPKVGRRVIAPALWSRGLSRIDAVVLSHADADHYNGLPDLLERFAIGSLVVPPGFGEGPDGAAAGSVLLAARSRGVTVRTLAAGEPWEEVIVGRGDAGSTQSGRLSISVEHPPRDWLPGAPDNDRSLVLLLTHEDRRVLLTGDLDGAGLAEFLARPIPPVDAMLAPHHGGRTANPPWLYDHARPGLVVASQAPPMYPGRDALAPLDDRGAAVLRTWERGAIRIAWDDGGLAAAGFLGGYWRAGEGGECPDRLALVDEPTNAAWGVGGIATRLVALWNPGMNLWTSWNLVSVVTLSVLPWLAALLGFLLGATALAVLTIVEWGAWTLVRPGRRPLAEDDPWPGPVEPSPWEPIATVAPDGVRLEGAFRRAEGVPAHGRTALFLHGFAEDRSGLRGRAEALARLGWNVVLVDSRGRGRSGGDWSTFGDREVDDVRAWLDALEARSDPAERPTRFVVWGRSMGAAIALRAAASDPRVRALVLEAPYADLAQSVAAWFRRTRLPGWLAGWTLRRAGRLSGAVLDRPRPVDLAHRVTVPVLILHGSEDRITPPTEIRRLAAALPTPPTVIEVAGARHADVYDVAGPDLAGRVAAFLDAEEGSLGGRPTDRAT